MKTLLKHRLLLFFLILSSSLFSQINNGIGKYLDDGKSSSPWLIKFNPLAVYEGDVSFIIEKKVSDVFALQGGLGVALPYYNDPLIYDLITNPDSEDFTFSKPKIGVVAHLGIRGYLSDDWSKSFYYELPLRYRWYSGQINLFDLNANFGYQKIWDSGFLVDASLGLGLLFQNSIDKKTYVFDASELIIYDHTEYPNIDFSEIGSTYPSVVRFHFPITIKVGYQF